MIVVPYSTYNLEIIIVESFTAIMKGFYIYNHTCSFFVCPRLGYVLANFLEALLQRVVSASVTVDKTLISAIGRGVLVFAAVAPGDGSKVRRTTIS